MATTIPTAPGAEALSCSHDETAATGSTYAGTARCCTRGVSEAAVGRSAMRGDGSKIHATATVREATPPATVTTNATVPMAFLRPCTAINGSAAVAPCPWMQA